MHSPGYEALSECAPAGWILLTIFLATNVSIYAQPPSSLILDADLGNDIDDEFALAIAVQSPELNLRALTIVGDNAEDRMRLAWKELGLYGRTDIEIARGAPEPLLNSAAITHSSHLSLLTREDLLPPAINSQATTVINNTIRYSSTKVTIVATGPLTNIALALKIDPRMKQNLARIVIVGGAFNPPRAEYNIQRDPIAADIVFSSGVPITVIGRDAVVGCSLEEGDVARLRAAGFPASQFLTDLIAWWQPQHADAYPNLIDPVAVAASFRPDLIETEPGNMTIGWANPRDSAAAWFEPAKGPPNGERANVALARDLNIRAFLDLLIKRLTAPPRAGTPSGSSILEH